MLKRKHVLVVDDELGILGFVRISLTKAGYDVTTTADGEEALQLVRSQSPDIMLLDILMQPVSGFEVLHRLRSFSQIPVIVFTAKREIADLALQEGANDYLSKPFIPNDLVKKIEAALSTQPGQV